MILPRLSLAWQLCLAVSIEGLWEVIENSELVIRRYRQETAALGYHGDTIVNSLGDILVCALGFMLARRPGSGRTLGLFAVTEMVLVLWIRGSLLLNIVMLVHPIDAIKDWQAVGH